MTTERELSEQLSDLYAAVTALAVEVELLNTLTILELSARNDATIEGREVPRWLERCRWYWADDN